MDRATIDFGIDLGTTNSCLAVLDGTATRIIRTNENAETTPSVVAFDAKGRMYVGERAKNQQISTVGTEYADVCLEFKTGMGHPEPFQIFQRYRLVVFHEHVLLNVHDACLRFVCH